MAILIDTPSNGSTVSFVNAVINEEGGVHVQSWKKELYAPILQHLKKYKVKEADINNYVSLILMCRLLNPKYRSQTKDKLTAPKPTVNVGSELK
jgi:DNA gyrase/topoisomerase IV subunit B